MNNAGQKRFGQALVGAIISAVALTNHGTAAAQTTAEWTNLTSGINNTVLALAVGRNGEVYAGGKFTTIGGMKANYIAKWTGADGWTNLGAGMDSEVTALATGKNRELFAGGKFSSAGGVSANYVAQWTSAGGWTNLGSGGRGAKWTGTCWTTGSGMNTPVLALAVGPKGELYASGSILITNPPRNSLKVDKGPDGKLMPSLASVVERVEGVVKWTGTRWTLLGADMNSPASALAVGPNGELYAGGRIVISNPPKMVAGPNGMPMSTNEVTTLSGVLKWTGTRWAILGCGMNGPPRALAVGPQGTLYVSGYFTNEYKNCVAQWTGGGWNKLGLRLREPHTVLAAGPNGKVYAGGRLRKQRLRTLPPDPTIEPYRDVNIIEWTGTGWVEYELGLNKIDVSVTALAFGPNCELYVAGELLVAGRRQSYIIRFH